MRRSAFSTKFPPKPTRKDASPKLRVTTTTTGHPGSKGRRPLYIHPGRTSLFLAIQVFLFLFQRPESIQRKQILLHGRPADALPTTTVTRPPTTRDYQPWEYSLPADECYPHRYANDRSNLDFYMYAMGGRISFENTSSAIFSLLRLTGNYGDCLPEITTAADEDDEVEWMRR